MGKSNKIALAFASLPETTYNPPPAFPPALKDSDGKRTHRCDEYWRADESNEGEKEKKTSAPLAGDNF